MIARCPCGHWYSITIESHTCWAVHISFETAAEWFEVINDKRRRKK